LVAYRALHGNKAARNGATKHAEQFANEVADSVAPLILKGLSDAAIATALSDDGIETRRCARWHETSVRRLRARLAI
jgi:hypothetical protein